MTVRAIYALLHSLIPTDEEIKSEFRTSLNNVPNVRLSAKTTGRTWSVDVYSSRFYVVAVSDRPSSTFDNPPSVIRHLCAMLQIQAGKQ